MLQSDVNHFLQVWEQIPNLQKLEMQPDSKNERILKYHPGYNRNKKSGPACYGKM
jgi:hypothetical protein